MKTTIDIPDALVSRAKIAAAQSGTTMRTMVVSGLERTLAELQASSGPVKPAWLAAFGGMKSRHEESDRLLREIEAEFEQVDAEAWK